MKRLFSQNLGTLATLLLTVIMAFAPGKAAADDGYDAYWWNYPPAKGKVDYVKIHAPGTTYAGVFVPDSLGEAVLDSVRIYCKDPATMTNVRVWVSSSLASITADNIVATLPTVKAGENTVKLATPYAIPFEGVYVGYVFDNNAADGYTYSPRLKRTTEGGYYIFNETYTKNYWQSNMTTVGLGNLGFKLHLNVPRRTPDNVIVSVAPADPATAKVGASASTAVTVRNRGSNTVSKLSLALEVNGRQTVRNYTLSPALAKWASTTLNLTLPVQTEAGSYNITGTVDKVNGRANTATGNRNAFAFGQVLVEQSQPRTVVFEEFTGTWCGWCPRGAVAMNKLEESCGDDYVGIAVHSGDPMYTADYYDLLAAFNPIYPTATVNRILKDVDPYLAYQTTAPAKFDGMTLFREGQQQPTEGTVKLEARWDSPAKNVLTVNTQTTIAVNYTDAPYALAFVLTEDGMSGEGQDWMQCNYMAGMSATYPDPDLAAYTAKNAPDYVTTTYNHVAVAAWEPYNGIENSVSGTVKAGEVMNYTAKLDITGNTLIQSRHRLKVIALLLNRRNHTIVNADLVDLTDPTGIQPATVPGSRAAEVARYNTAGVRLAAPAKGLNIVKLSDGRTVKVMVK